MIRDYLAWKATLSGDMGFSEALLHVHAGLAIFVVAALIFRRKGRTWIPLAVVLAVALGNELIDYYYSPRWEIQSSAKDAINTILWPAILSLIARWRGV
jgi:lipoprotein signal peptidase